MTGAVPFFKKYMFVQKGSIIGTLKEHISTYGAFPLHGTARYGTVRFTFGGFSTGYCT